MEGSAMIASNAPAARPAGMTRVEKRVVFAASLGTIFEWDDFYLYGALASIIADQFFDQFPRSTREFFALLAFAAGFIVRPLGAIVLGTYIDHHGRRAGLLLTLVLTLTTWGARALGFA